MLNKKNKTIYLFGIEELFFIIIGFIIITLLLFFRQEEKIAGIEIFACIFMYIILIYGTYIYFSRKIIIDYKNSLIIFHIGYYKKEIKQRSLALIKDINISINDNKLNFELTYNEQYKEVISHSFSYKEKGMFKRSSKRISKKLKKILEYFQ